MKAQFIATLFAATAAASPQVFPGMDDTMSLRPVYKRADMPPAIDACLDPPKGQKKEPCNPKTDCNYCALTMTDLEDKPCREILWIFARASTEDGNMVSYGLVLYMAT
jgi:hypothetical protein